MASSACTSDNDDSAGKDPKESPSTSAPSSESTKTADPTEQAKADVISLYSQYWQQMERAYAKGSADGTDLKKYAAGPALVGAKQEIKGMYQADQIVTGKVTLGNPTVTKIDLTRKVPNATLSTCLDVSKWDVIDRKTKKKAALPKDRLTKYVSVATVERWPDGWKVIKDEPQETAC
ncbi:hypothetical protein [Streptomyces sp. NPDC005407]|uniref:hypothetical protein n=1 Tax=Streptomyces sp. NPDC005407 TaxID=3155340 RepID=UPI0033A63583